MPITIGTTIIADDLNNIWRTALNTLRTRTTSNNPYKQFVAVLQFPRITSTTAEHLRTQTYIPRTDLILRSARVFGHAFSGSQSTGIEIRALIPAGIREDERIIGGNIVKDLRASVITDGAGDPLTNSGVFELPTNEIFGFLAGDSIDIIVGTTATGTAHDITVSLTFESLMTRS
jgi:hypothetical protein